MGKINVGYTELEAKAADIEEFLKNVKAHRDACTAAGEAAVAAGGGDTQVGEAIKSAIVDVSDSQFEAVMKVITDFAAAMRDVAANYKTFDTNLTTEIQAIAAKRRALLDQQNGTASTGQ